MLSDVLHDAVTEIRDWQNKMPEQYDNIKEWVDAVVKEMEALRRYLDLPFMSTQVYAMRRFLYCPQGECRKWLLQAGQQDERCLGWLAHLKEVEDGGTE